MQAETNNLSSSSTTVTALFKDYQNAERAYQFLLEKGYKKEEINLFMSEETRKKHFLSADHAETEIGNKSLEGMGVGGAIGGTIGAISAALLAVGSSLVIPALGIVVAGPLAASMAGAGAGGAVGTLVGFLVGSGLPDEKAKLYESGIKNGGIAISVHPHSAEDSQEIENQWRGYEGENIFKTT